MIPEQLRREEFRFILVQAKDKRPIEQGWQEENNYHWDDPKLQDWIAKGGNYGVVCGVGGIAVFDADEIEDLENLGIMRLLPGSMTVSSSPGKEHRYYIIPGMTKKIVMKHNGKHLGEIQGPGAQVVGPGSVHPSGAVYTVINDLPIAEMSYEVFSAILGLLGKSARKWTAEMAEDSARYGDISKLKIEDVGYPAGNIKFTGDEIQGAHPFHGSDGGKNYRIDPQKNVWRCDRCFPAGTLVTTPDGLRPIETIRVGDQVFGLKNAVQCVSNTFHRVHVGNFITIDSCLYPVKCTWDHPILVAECPECTKEYESFGHCLPSCSRRYRPPRYGKCPGNGNHTIKWVQANEIVPGKHFLLVPRIQFESHDSISGVPLSPELGSLIGWYVAEGHIKTEKGRKPGVEWTLNISEKKESARILRNIRSVFGVPGGCCEVPSQNVRRAWTRSIKAGEVMQNFGLGASNKTFGKMLFAPKNVLRNALGSYIQGDGCYGRSDNRIQISTVSTTLTREIQLALLYVDGKSSQSWISAWDKTSGMGKYDKNYVTTYKNRTKNTMGWIDENFWYVPIKNVHVTESTEHVFNLETDDHTYQVPFIVHNCESGGGTALFLAMKYGILECGDCQPGALRGDDFREVLRRATEEGLIALEEAELPKSPPEIPAEVLKTEEPIEEEVLQPEIPKIKFNPVLKFELEKTNFISQYVEFAKTTSDAYEEYHFASAITLLSMAVDRNLTVAMQHGDIHLNTWLFALGDSTISRKTTAHKLCYLMLKSRFPKNALPSAFSPEALTEAIAETPRGYLAKDEAGSLLAAMKKDYMAETRDFFCEIYECGDYYRRTKKSGEIYITDPYIVQYLMTTPSSLREYTTVHDIMSGWLVRYLWFAPNHPKDWRPITQKTEATIKLWDAIQIEYLKKCASIPKKRILRVSDSGMAYYSKWQREVEERLMVDGDNVSKAIAGRLSIYAIKLAGLFTFGRADFGEDTEVSEEHVKEATRLICDYFLPVGCGVIAEVERSESTNTQNKIIGALKRMGGKIGRRDLLRLLHLRLGEVADAIEALKESGEIGETLEKSDKGNLITVYYLSGV